MATYYIEEFLKVFKAIASSLEQIELNTRPK